MLIQVVVARGEAVQDVRRLLAGMEDLKRLGLLVEDYASKRRVRHCAPMLIALYWHAIVPFSRCRATRPRWQHC